MNNDNHDALKTMAEVSGRIAELQVLSVGKLAKLHLSLCEEPTRSRNKDYLRKKLAWRIQEMAEGGLSERAKARIEELNKSREPWTYGFKPMPTPAELRKTPKNNTDRDPRLPAPGTVIVKKHKGTEYRVLVRQNDFEYDDEIYPSLSKVAAAITGSHWNGFVFFRKALADVNEQAA